MGGDGQTVAAASSSPIGAQHLSEPRRLRRSARPRSPVWLLSQARRGVVALRHGEGEQPTVLKAVRGGCKSRRRLQIEGQCAAALSPSYPLSLERKLRTYWQWPVRGVVLSQRRGEEGEGDGESTEKRHREQIRPSAARKATPPSTSVPSPRLLGKYWSNHGSLEEDTKRVKNCLNIVLERFSPVNHVMEDQCFIESIPPLGTAIGVFNNLAEYDVACFDYMICTRSTAKRVSTSQLSWIPEARGLGCRHIVASHRVVTPC
ncbi:hypothetical protein TRIUR3_00410 [Triticum urartu]|uniref:Uncharacterized protein n=1 Tax=Triticum urartu TaxID=4572 RepID=M8B2V7_TRIUA|nr:hypothetical protein TRIUR3_00410 [Triticum urartu]